MLFLERIVFSSEIFIDEKKYVGEYILYSAAIFPKIKSSYIFLPHCPNTNLNLRIKTENLTIGLSL